MQVIILCDGRKPSPERFRRHLALSDLFIAADGGGNRAREMNVDPDVVIGDLDSYLSHPDDTFDVIHDPDQECNDLEKAIKHALSCGGKKVTVYGAIGKRVDHTLKNLSVLKKFNHRFQSLVFVDSYGDMSLLPREFKANFPIGTTLSLIPLSGRVDGITTRGLKYPLRNEALETGVRDGTSNEVTTGEVEITYNKGDLLLFVALNPETL